MNTALQRARKAAIRFSRTSTIGPKIAQTAVALILLLALLGGFAMAASTWGTIDYSEPYAMSTQQKTDAKAS